MTRLDDGLLPSNSHSAGSHSGQLDGWLGDLRQAGRRALRAPLSVGLMVVIVALCTAATLALSGLIDSVLLRPLGFPQPERLVRIWESQEGDARVGAAKGNLADWRWHSEAFDGIAGWYVAPRTFLSDGLAEVLPTAQVSADFFAVLARAPVEGRTFTAEETARAVFNSANSLTGADPVVVISHRLWQRLGGGATVGREVTIDRRSWQVIGVMPTDFGMPSRDIDLWIPWSFAGELPRDQRYVEVAARLAPGVTLEQAQSDLNRIADDLSRRFPDTNSGWGVHVEPLHEVVVGDAEPYLCLAAISVGCLVLLAGIHLVSLQWVRMASRGRELRVRQALGAPESALVRSLVVESQVPVLMGVLLGWPFAALALAALRRWQPAGLPRIDEVAIHPVALAVTCTVALGIGILSSLLPALAHGRKLTSRAGFSAGLRVATVGVRHRSSWWVASEVALALTVLMVATWVGQSWLRLMEVDPGFEPKGVYVAPVLLDNVGYRTGSDSRAYYRKVLDELSAMPGVEAAGASTVPPLAVVGPDFARPVWAQGESEPLGGHRRADVRMVTPGYFATLGVPLLQGRPFADSDDETARPMVIVSQSLARRHWPDDDPVGQHLIIDYSSSGTNAYEIVGVVGDLRMRGPRGKPRPELYLPHAQRPYLVMNLLLRSASAPAELETRVRETLLRLDPSQPAHSFFPLTDRVGESLERERSTAWLVALLGVVALALSSLGVYSLLTVVVALERPEIGIRSALGADPQQIVRWIVGRGLRACLMGLAAGVVLSVLVFRATSGLLSGILFEVDPMSPSSFAATAAMAAALVLVAAVAASLPPARRGASVDPVETLRRS